MCLSYTILYSFGNALSTNPSTVSPLLQGFFSCAFLYLYYYKEQGLIL